MADVETVFLPEEKIRAWGRLVFKECGLPDNEAADVLDALVSSNLRGVDTHGINLARFYAERYKAVPHREITTEIDLPAFCKINGGNNMGPVVGTYAMKRAMEKADLCGVGMALVSDSCHFGAAGYYTLYAAQKGYVGFSTTTGVSLLAHWGGLDMKVSNCPFSVSFPGEEFPVVLDIANSVTARQKIIMYAREGKTLPEGWAMDTEGNPTTDAQKALDGLLMPIGGYKGIGIATMVDIVCGVLNQGCFCDDACKNAETDKPQNTGHLFAAIKTSLIVPDEKRNEMLEEYLEKYHGVRRKKGVDTILVPGEIEWKRQQERKTSGIPISMALIKECDDYAEKIKIAKIREI